MIAVVPIPDHNTESASALAAMAHSGSGGHSILASIATITTVVLGAWVAFLKSKIEAMHALEAKRIEALSAHEKTTAAREDTTEVHLLEAWKIERAAALTEREELRREREDSRRERREADAERRALLKELNAAQHQARLDHELAETAMHRNDECAQRLTRLEQQHAGCPGRIAMLEAQVAAQAATIIKLERDIAFINFAKESS